MLERIQRNVVKMLYDVKMFLKVCYDFQDIFDEDSFYIFAAVFTVLTCLATFLASKYIKIKPKD